MDNKRFYINGLALDNLSKNQFLKFINFLLKKNAYSFITYLNAHVCNIGWTNAKFRNILNNSTLIYADGWGPVIAGRLLGIPIKERMTTYEFFPDFCRLTEKEKIKIYLLGSKKNVLKKTVIKLKNIYPNIKLVGWHSGYFKNNNEIINNINISKPDVLLVGMGSPKQEFWLWENKSKLKIKIGWVVGGLFDYLSGEKIHCPKWLGKFGIQWFYRLICEPKRLLNRYLYGIPIFCWNIIKFSLQKR